MTQNQSAREEVERFALAFVTEQSEGEWGEDLIKRDADKLTDRILALRLSSGGQGRVHSVASGSSIPTEVPDGLLDDPSTVEFAAMALERATTARGYGWTEEQFQIWWNSDPLFVERKNVWSDFRGTAKQRVIWITRTVLEAASQVGTDEQSEGLK